MAEYFKPTFFEPKSNIKQALDQDDIELKGNYECALHSNLLLTSLRFYDHLQSAGFVSLVEHLLATKFAGHRLVWAGDYGKNVSLKNDIYENRHNVYKYTSDAQDMYDTEKILKGNIVPYEKRRYILNLDKKEYVEIPKSVSCHPLPILTYCGDTPSIEDAVRDNCKGVEMGAWCADRLKAVESVPDGFTRLEWEIPRKADWK